MTEEVHVDRSVRRLTELVHLLHELFGCQHRSRQRTEPAGARHRQQRARRRCCPPSALAQSATRHRAGRSADSERPHAHTMQRIVRGTSGQAPTQPCTAVHATGRSEGPRRSASPRSRRRHHRGGDGASRMSQGSGGTADACIPGVSWLQIGSDVFYLRIIRTGDRGRGTCSVKQPPAPSPPGEWAVARSGEVMRPPAPHAGRPVRPVRSGVLCPVGEPDESTRGSMSGRRLPAASN